MDSSPAVIDSFTGPFSFLSNFHPAPVTFDGEVYATSEAAFNAGKSLYPHERAHVRDADSPGEAKRRGRNVTLRPGWDEHVRYDVMSTVLASKFTDENLAGKLLATGDALLIEGNRHHDQHWGDCTCTKHASWPGANHLGRALMALRARLRAEPADRWVRVAVTGHRPHLVSAQQAAFGRSELVRLAGKLRDEHGTQVAISGLALGADSDWAHAGAGAGLDVWAYCPFTAQADSWGPDEKATWADLRSSASRVVTLGTDYNVRLLHARNDLMLRDADLVIAVTRPSLKTGGTASTIAKARAAALPLITVDLDAMRTSLNAPAR